MPTYSYACTECDNRFDAVQAFSDDALTTCPQCRAPKIQHTLCQSCKTYKGRSYGVPTEQA